MGFDRCANIVAVDDDCVSEKTSFIGCTRELVEIARVGSQEVDDWQQLGEDMKSFVTNREGPGHGRHRHGGQQELAGRQSA